MGKPYKHVLCVGDCVDHPFGCINHPDQCGCPALKDTYTPLLAQLEGAAELGSACSPLVLRSLVAQSVNMLGEWRAALVIAQRYLHEREFPTDHYVRAAVDQALGERPAPETLVRHTLECTCGAEVNGGTVHTTDCGKRAALKANEQPCDHKAPQGGMSIISGYNRGYSTVWCTRCGRITWCGDGLLSNSEAKRNDYDEWTRKNVAAFGCQSETGGRTACQSYCGSLNCAVSLRAAENGGDGQ